VVARASVSRACIVWRPGGRLTRRCSKCGESKPLDSGHFNAAPKYAHSSGFRSICRVCSTAAQRARRDRLKGDSVEQRQAEHFARHPPTPMSEEITEPGVPPMSIDRWGEVDTDVAQVSRLLQRDIPQIQPARVSSARTLAIGDTHAPFAHPSSLDFLAAIKAEFSPDLVVHMGDEVDNHGMSFHEKNPALPGQAAELDESRTWIRQLERLFPEVVIKESNHGSLLYRKALHHGISEEYLRNYNEVLRVGQGWRWQFSLTIESPSGPVYFEHGQKGTARTIARAMGVSVVQGHRHGECYAETWNNSLSDVFAMQTGCLIDNRSRAFLYNRKHRLHPVIGTGIILDGRPYIIRLGETKSGRWDRRLGLRVA
jgi:hypothetical protein